MVAGICLIIMVTIFFGELVLKNHIERNFIEGKTLPKWKGRILLRKHYNRGAMLNFGETKQKLIALLSVILTIIAVVVFIITLGHRGNNLLRIGLAFLLGGAFSNTYDRVKRKYVVDYFSFGVPWKGRFWQKFRNVVFNISDICIILGAALTAIGEIGGGRG